MEALKLNADAHTIVMGLLHNYVQRQMQEPGPTKTAETLGHMLAGIKTSRYYRVDIPESGRALMAREYLLGILTDRPGV